MSGDKPDSTEKRTIGEAERKAFSRFFYLLNKTFAGQASDEEVEQFRGPVMEAFDKAYLKACEEFGSERVQRFAHAMDAHYGQAFKSRQEPEQEAVNF